MASETFKTGIDLPAAYKRISWSAVFAGVVVTIMVALLLNLLGIGIGLTTIEATTAEPFAGLGIAASIWWVVSSLVALFAGGCVAGRLAGVTRTYDATIHGILTWGLVTLITLYLLTTAMGALVGGAANMLGRGLSGMGQQSGQQMTAQHGGIGQTAAMAQIRAEANILILGDTPQTQQGAAQNRQEVAQQLNQALNRMFAQGAVNEAERPNVVNLIVTGSGESREEVEQLVNRWTSMYQQGQIRFEAAGTGIEQRVAQAGERAAEGAGKASLWLFAGLVLGGIAAAFGGRMGIPRDLVLKEKDVA